MKDIDLGTLRHFIAVCETGSITRAAEQSHLVASAVSKRLAQLEHELGVPLLQRRRRGVAPTAAGESLLEHARALLSAAGRLAQDMAAFGSGVHGQVRLLSTVSAIAGFLPDDVAAFLKLPEHRQIRVDIEEHLSRDVVRRVKEGSASLGVLWDATALDGLRAAPYRIDHLAVVAPAAHPLARRRQCRFEETLDYEHVGLQASSAVDRLLSRAAALAGKRLVYRTQVSNFEATLRVVRADLGIAIVPAEIAASHAPTRGLRVIALRDAWARRRFTICYRDRETLARPAAMLLDHLTAAARRRPRGG